MSGITVHDMGGPSAPPTPEDLESYRLSLLTLYAALRSTAGAHLAAQRQAEPASQEWFSLWKQAMAKGEVADAVAWELKEAMFSAGIHTLEIPGWRARIVPAEHSKYFVTIVIERRVI